MTWKLCHWWLCDALDIWTSPLLIFGMGRPRWGFILAGVWGQKVPWESSRANIPGAESQDAQRMTPPGRYFWTPGRLFNMILSCFWKSPKRDPCGWKCGFWSASTSAFPDFCFSHLAARHLTEFLWGMKWREGPLSTYRNYSLGSCPGLTEVERTRKQVFIKSLRAGQRAEETELFLLGKIVKEASLIMHITKNGREQWES